jgi:hypothetical protein
MAGMKDNRVGIRGGFTFAAKLKYVCCTDALEELIHCEPVMNSIP